MSCSSHSLHVLLWRWCAAAHPNVLSCHAHPEAFRTQMLPERFFGGGVIIPDDVKVQDFLDRCQEAGRHVLEEKIAKLRSQAAASLKLAGARHRQGGRSLC